MALTLAGPDAGPVRARPGTKPTAETGRPRLKHLRGKMAFGFLFIF